MLQKNSLRNFSMNFFFVLLCAVAILFPSIAFSGNLHSEKYYQELWCNEHNGVMEYRLDDGTRVDCLMDNYAIEFDFAPKWAESVGQSLYYAAMTGKKPGVVLIMERADDDRFAKRLDTLAHLYRIKVWRMTPDKVPSVAPIKH